MKPRDHIAPEPDEAKTIQAVPEEPPVSRDLERCPRCGWKIGEILWGHTDCPNCGLHFECC